MDEYSIDWQIPYANEQAIENEQDRIKRNNNENTHKRKNEHKDSSKPSEIFNSDNKIQKQDDNIETNEYTIDGFVVCHLNVNGWTEKNSNLRKKIVEYSKADVFCVNETHLNPKSNLEGIMSDYVWIGHNRSYSHINAKRSFGGVGMFVKKCIMNNFHVTIVDKEHDGILAVKFVNDKSKYSFVVISSYLPPDNSRWGRDATGFYNHLVMILYRESDSDMIIMAGDLNSRIGSMKDCHDTDIPVREIIDDSKNQHGHALIEFLQETNCCIVNGRFEKDTNAYTSVTKKGNSVVDYFVVPMCNLKHCMEFQVELCSEIVEKCQIQELINQKCKIPDHALLRIKFVFD